MNNNVSKIWNQNFILLTTANFLMCVTYYAIISTLPIYLVGNLHAGKRDVGIVLAAYTIASVLIRPFGGFSLDKFGRRTIYLLALSIYVFFFCGYLVAYSIVLLVVLRFMQGITWGVATIASSTVAVDFIPTEKRGEGLGYFAVSTTLGMSFGPLAGLFIYHHLGYTAMFISCIAISFVSLLCAGLIKFPLLNKCDVSFSWNNLFDKKAVIPSANLFVIMLTYGGLLSFIALYGREIGIQNTSMFFLIFSFGIITSRLTAGKSFDRNGPKNLLTLNLSLLVIGYSILVIFKSITGYYISAIVIGYGIGVVFPIFQTIVNNLANPLRRGAANSTLFTALDLGMGSGMVLMGYIAQYYSISLTFIISAGITFIGLIQFRKYVVPHYSKAMKQ